MYYRTREEADFYYKVVFTGNLTYLGEILPALAYALAKIFV